jgi:hypothetical protein
MKIKIRIYESQDLKLMYLCGNLNIKINDYSLAYDSELQQKILEIDIDDLYIDLINVLFIDDIVKPVKVKPEIKTKINPEIYEFSELKKVTLSLPEIKNLTKLEFYGSEWTKIVERLDFYKNEDTSTIAIETDYNKLLHEYIILSSANSLEIKLMIENYHIHNENEKMLDCVRRFNDIIRDSVTHQTYIKIEREYD